VLSGNRRSGVQWHADPKHLDSWQLKHGRASWSSGQPTLCVGAHLSSVHACLSCSCEQIKIDKTHLPLECRLKAQELRPEGNAPMQAYVGVQLTMPDGQGTLQLSEEHAPLLQVLSGPASRMEGRSERWVDHTHTP
jgi:hypothetical protein